MENGNDFHALKIFLDDATDFFNCPDFIPEDPISIPHRYELREDIEISAFLAAIMAWGNRKTIITKAWELLERMGHQPFKFVMDDNPQKYKFIEGFKHRTLNEEDIIFLLEGLHFIYKEYKSPEKLFKPQQNETDTSGGIRRFVDFMLEIPHSKRSIKHLPNLEKGSAAKRINLFLRWMVRKDDKGVDFGLWNIPASKLLCPLDVHSGHTARKLGLITRAQNDLKAVIELTSHLRELDANDPIKYDFALFGLSMQKNHCFIPPSVGLFENGLLWN